MENSDDVVNQTDDLHSQMFGDDEPIEENSENQEEVEDDEEYSQENDNDHLRRPKKKRSTFWNHFTEIIGADGSKYAKCKHSPCEAKYKVSGKNNSSTGNLIKHMQRKHPEVIAVEAIQQQEAFVFSQDKFRQALLKWVVMCDQPFNAPTEQAFIDLVNTLNPDAHIVCDKTIRSDLMLEYNEKIKTLKREVNAVPGKISITLDGWTSKNGLPFLAIRGHWLDADWNLQTKLLDFAYIDGSHDGYNHSVILRECLDRLEIPFTKILAITSDNASSNDTLFVWLENYGLSAVTSQVRCLAHVLNLAAQDLLTSLKVPYDHDPDYDEWLENEVLPDIDLNDEIEDDQSDDDEEHSSIVILKMRKLIKKIRKSTKLRQKLKKVCTMHKLKYLVPIIDVKTRWNSTYAMIIRAKYLRIALKHLCVVEKSLADLDITSRDWYELEKIAKLLVKFDRATNYVSMARHPTICGYLPILDWLIVST